MNIYERVAELEKQLEEALLSPKTHPMIIDDLVVRIERCDWLIKRKIADGLANHFARK